MLIKFSNINFRSWNYNKISAPILSLIYPATIVLIVVTIFNKYFKNDNVS